MKSAASSRITRPRRQHRPADIQTLSDIDLLALFLGKGSAGHSATELAQALLGAAGGLRQLLDVGASTSLPSISPTHIARLRVAVEMGRRLLAQPMLRTDVFANPGQTRQFLTARLRHLRYEVFACLFLDSQHRLIAFRELFRGTIDGASVYPREVVTECLSHNAAAVIFAHNHPSGHSEPSAADRQITQRLTKALALVDIRVLDHLVIGEGAAISFAERGLL